MLLVQKVVAHLIPSHCRQMSPQPPLAEEGMTISVLKIQFSDVKGSTSVNCLQIQIEERINSLASLFLPVQYCSLCIYLLVLEE